MFFYSNFCVSQYRIRITLGAGTCLYTLHFADDQVLCAGNKSDIEYVARKLKDNNDEYYLMIIQQNIKQNMITKQI